MCPPTSFPDATAKDTSHTVPEGVPTDQMSQAAYRHAAKNIHVSILNHSLRVWCYAKAIGDREKSQWTSNEYRSSLLFAACILHDVGACDFLDGPERFEIEAADYAEGFLREHGVEQADAREVWIAMALHSTPQIAERIAPLARLVRLAVTIDFKSLIYLPTMTRPSEVAAFEVLYPRLDIEKVLGDTVADQVVRQPAKGPNACSPGGLYRSKLANPDWNGINKAF